MANFTTETISFSASIVDVVLANTPAWQASHAYNAGDVVVVNASNNIANSGTLDNQVLLCVIPGTSQSNIHLIGITNMHTDYNGSIGAGDGSVGWVTHPNYPLAIQWNTTYSPPAWGSLTGSFFGSQYPSVDSFVQSSPSGHHTVDRVRLPNGKVMRCVQWGNTGGSSDTPYWANNSITYGNAGYYDQKVLFIGNTVWVSDTVGFQVRTDGNTSIWTDSSDS